MRAKVLVIATVLASFSLSPSAVFAEGGTSIATAPPVVFGQQEFGNTANGGRVFPYFESFWTLSVTTGDQLTIDWEAQPRSGTVFQIYPVSTNDFNLQQENPLKRQGETPTGKNEMHLETAQTGSMPLIVRGGTGGGGPYDFTAYVQHAVSLTLPSLSKLRHRATLNINVHSPEGAGINDAGLTVVAEVRSSGPWHAVGKASVANSVAKVPVKIPRSLWGHTVSLRATANGASYLRTRSDLRRVEVP